MSRCRRLLPLAVALVVILLRTAWPSGTEAQGGPPALIVDRVLESMGGAAASRVVDAAAEGKLTYFNNQGPQAAFDVTLLRKGTSHVQRIVKQHAGDLRQGTDGRTSWNVFKAFRASAEGGASHFLESQTVRSVQRLIDSQRERLNLRDAGQKDGARVIEAEDGAGRSTRYSIDETRNTVTAIEFVTGGQTGRYVLSDYRRVQGVLTPFRIERYSGAGKIEDMQFTSVQFNTSLPETAFKP